MQPPPSTDVENGLRFFLAPSTPLDTEHKQHVLTATAHAGASYTAAMHADTTQNTTIALLMQLREEERREWRRLENGGEESVKIPCRKVENPNINAFSDPNLIIVKMPVYLVCDISILSLGT
jgi:hypothetical protein